MTLLLESAFVHYDPRLRGYGTSAPFSPGERYPEYQFHDADRSGSNPAYAAVREFLALCGFDARHKGQREWNPLGELIRPGDVVTIKPNLVLHENANGGSLECVITHASLIRAVVDYVLIALNGSGSVIIGDAPLQSADFARIRALSGLDELLDYYRRRAPVPVELVDFRCEYARTDAQRNVLGVRAGMGDPRGYAAVDFGSRSMLSPTAERFERYRVTNYDPARMPLHHNAEKHEYLVARSVLDADVVISMPKMKTHRKAGVTGALKNCVGINGHKDWLPHHSKGSRARGGDEYQHASLLKAAACALTESGDVATSRAGKELFRAGAGLLHIAGKVAARDPYFEGSWWGNDTIWRTVLDLNRALVYADREGSLRSEPQRRVFFLIDGIVAGEGEGPIEPSPKPAGLLIGAASAPIADAVMARLMGFDFRKIPAIREAFHLAEMPLARIDAKEIAVVSNSAELSKVRVHLPGTHFGFVPTMGWKGHIELEPSLDRIVA